MARYLNVTLVHMLLFFFEEVLLWMSDEQGQMDCTSTIECGLNKNGVHLQLPSQKIRTMYSQRTRKTDHGNCGKRFKWNGVLQQNKVQRILRTYSSNDWSIIVEPVCTRSQGLRRRRKEGGQENPSRVPSPRWRRCWFAPSPVVLDLGDVVDHDLSPAEGFRC
jgi:hypothetical protein